VQVYCLHCSRLASWYERVYFYWSFGFLLVRTVTVSLSVAGINDESRLPQSVLYAVPTDGYNVEVSMPCPISYGLDGLGFKSWHSK
jgi:hypothetical protein